ncbi:zinc transport system substrate-binding protein [Microbulbifer donghaiensis]|uniref:High-affinity zinc uptake system protein ZnuA n=1 Tax=Microbulbifer donghaiensis TaxID=494016 RepID=A0A1M5AXQ5_9GAMM|nr:zinc ABC transporter substrate-binding protein [Microbulbifer donghaiensis]SHF34926.1 zinc transport system substrate-binding protein [Microbulbifer donghaiensis]
MSVMFFLKRLSLSLCLVLLAACDRPASTADRELVVSIRPLALIAREIVGADMPLRVLISSGDPHHYAPNVSARAALERAQLVVWMGPQLESVLARQAALLPAEQQLELLASGSYEYQGAAATDPHLWLRPRNAAIIAAQIAERLGQLQPQQAELYRSRARDFSRAMANQQKVLDRALWAYRDVPIVVTHDAYGHFFGSAGVVTKALSDSGKGGHGARALLQLQGRGDGCLFGEVPENDRDRQTAANLGLRYAALDPLAERLPANASYRDLVEQLLAQARSCLAEVPDATPVGSAG